MVMPPLFTEWNRECLSTHSEDGETQLCLASLQLCQCGIVFRQLCTAISVDILSNFQDCLTRSSTNLTSENRIGINKLKFSLSYSLLWKKNQLAYPCLISRKTSKCVPVRQNLYDRSGCGGQEHQQLLCFKAISFRFNFR